MDYSKKLNQIKTYIRTNSVRTKANKNTINDYIILAYKRHQEELKNKNWEYYFDEDEGARIIGFIQTLDHVKVVRGKIRLELWQKAMLFIIFGWRRKSNKKRRFNEVYVEIARKNGKSVLACGIMLYCWLCEAEIGAEGVFVATKKEQSNICYSMIKGMVEKNYDLQEVMYESHYKFYRKDEINATIMTVGKYAKSEDGSSPHCVVVDEYHAHEDNSMVEVMQSGQKARSNPLTFFITTAGYNFESECYKMREQLTKSMKMGTGLLENTAGFIYCLDEGDEYTDEKVWKKANPNLDVSVERVQISQDVKKSQERPELKAGVMTKNLNIWQKSSKSWISPETWKAVEDEALQSTAWHGKEVVLGIDLSKKTDFTAICICTMERVPSVFFKLYLPTQDVMSAVHRDKAPYNIWAEQNYLQVVESGIIEVDMMVDTIDDIRNKANVRAIYYDAYGMSDVIQRYEDDRYLECVAISQRSSYIQPFINELEADIDVRRMKAEVNPCIRWQTQNVVKTGKGMLTREKNSNNRIDGIMAMVMAVGGMRLYKGNREDGLTPEQMQEYERTGTIKGLLDETV